MLYRTKINNLTPSLLKIYHGLFKCYNIADLEKKFKFE